jgi:cytoskeletal protein CcmA (bactofilin family)
MIFDKKPAGALDPIANPSIPRTVPRNCLPPCAVIDASINIAGDLTTDGDVQIDGHINGNVICARLTVGKDGILSGDITAKEVVVRGTVTGTIRATRVMLLESASVAGDIFYDKMSMEEGAHFVGASNAEPLPCAAAPPLDPAF